MPPVRVMAEVPDPESVPNVAVIPVGSPDAASVMPLVTTPPTPLTVTVPALAALAAETTVAVAELIEA